MSLTNKKERIKIPSFVKKVLIVGLISTFATQLFLIRLNFAESNKETTEIKNIEQETENKEKRVRGSIVIGSYLQSDLNYNLNTELELEFDITKWKDNIFYVNTGMNTPIDIRATIFQPMKVKYLIEPGFRRHVNNSNISVFYQHQSWHDIDAHDEFSESFEILGIRVRGCSNKKNWNASIGRYINTCHVDYSWDARAGGKIEAGELKDFGLLLEGNMHFIIRSNCKINYDYSIEASLKKNKSNLSYLTRYKREHDADRFEGVTDDSILIGMKYKW